MQSFRRLPRRCEAAWPARARRPFFLPRRFESNSSSHHDDGHHHDAHAPPANETIGTWLYALVLGVPAFAVAYNYTTADSTAQPWVTRWISGMERALAGVWTARNDAHVRMLERAAADRNVFNHSKPVSTVELRFPEIVNLGSQINIPAGHYANMQGLVEHYERINAEEAERKAKALAERQEQERQEGRGS